MSLYKDCTYERFLPECENPITEKTVTVNMCGHIFTVSVGPESEIDDSVVCCSGLYDMYDAAKHFISSEDIIERDNLLRHTDFIPRPEISDFAIPLSEKQVEKRINFLTDCYRLLKDKKVLEAIVDFIPKNKDGRFLENSRTIIATSGMVSPTCSMFAIEAYTKSKLEISINVSWVDFSGDLKTIENDFLSSHPELLGNSTPASAPNIDSLKSVTKNDATALDNRVLSHVYQAILSHDEKTVYIPDGVEIISACFSKHKKIEKVVMPDSVIDINPYAFSECYQLSSVIFSKNLKHIFKRAFQYCPIQEVILPDCLETIDDEAFCYSGAIEQLHLSPKLRVIGTKAFCSAQIAELLLPNSLFEIREEAFVHCQNLRKVELPESLEYIGRRAFASCRLNSIRVRGIHTTFDDRIFENNHSQELIVYLNPNCRKIRLSAFEGIRNLLVVTENEELLSKFSGINNTKAVKAPYDEDLVR